MTSQKEHHKKQQTKKKSLSRSFYIKIFIILGIALVFFSIFNIFQVSSFYDLFQEKLEEAKEAARPADVELIVITTKCEDCFDINAVVDMVKTSGVNITKKIETNFATTEAKEYISKYGIEKVPTLIITGEYDKSKSLMFKFKDLGEEKQDSFVITSIAPPFVETATGKTRGKVSLVRLEKYDCSECIDLTPLIDNLEKAGIMFEQKMVDVDSEEGKKLVSKYDVKKVPTIIMDQEAEVYPIIEQVWNQVGSIEDDGSYVLQTISPPYYSIEEESVKGLVFVTYIKDKICTECYDPKEFHGQVLLRLGVSFTEEREMDISDEKAKSLIDRYKIEKIPTILLQGDVEEYPILEKAWDNVGTEESDGTYVFRKVEIAQQTYKDLSTNKIVEPE